MSTFQHVLVPIDFGESSQRALDLAVDLVKSLGGSLTIAHVYEIPTYGYSALTYHDADLERHAEEDARGKLEGALAAVRPSIPRVNGLLRRGAAWEQIVALIGETKADLVVMGTHGRHGIQRALLGSVAERTVRMSPVPVLMVPASTEPAHGAAEGSGG